MKIYIIHFKIKKIPEEWLILQKNNTRHVPPDRRPKHYP